MRTWRSCGASTPPGRKTGRPLASGLLSEEIEWVNASEAVEPGTRKGASAFGEAADAINAAFEGARVEFERFVDVGDDVVVIGTLRGKGHGSRIAVERRQGYVWTIRDGKAIRFEWFNDPAEALEAVGLREAMSQENIETIRRTYEEVNAHLQFPQELFDSAFEGNERRYRNPAAAFK